MCGIIYKYIPHGVIKLCKLNVNDVTMVCVCIDQLFSLRLETDCFLNGILIYLYAINLTIEHFK